MFVSGAALTAPLTAPEKPSEVAEVHEHVVKRNVNARFTNGSQIENLKNTVQFCRK